MRMGIFYWFKFSNDSAELPFRNVNSTYFQYKLSKRIKISGCDSRCEPLINRIFFNTTIFNTKNIYYDNTHLGHEISPNYAFKTCFKSIDEITKIYFLLLSFSSSTCL